MLSGSLIVPLIIFVYFVYQRLQPQISRNGNRLRSAPDTIPLLGNAIKFLQPRHILFDWFVKCQHQFGHETFEISVLSLPPGVVINDPTTLEFVLKNESSITKGDFFKQRSWDLFGYGIINANGDLWKAQRKAGLKFFAGSNLEAMIEDVLPEVYDNLRSQLVQAAEQGSSIDMAKWFLDLTTSVVGQMAYDMEIDASSPFSQAFDYASDHIGLRFQNPLYSITELFTGVRFRQALKEVRKFGRQIVSNAKTRRSHIAFESLIENEEPVFGSLIDSLIEVFRQPQIIADAALNFLSAGRDTTAQSLTWTLYALLRNPDALVRIRTEIEAMWSQVRSRTPEQKLSVANLQPTSMPNAMAVFYESLRLYPPVPFELKQCETDITLPDGTFLPQSSIIVWCIWAMNRSRQTFGEDADQFRPGRWLDGEHKLISKTAFEFPVFNGGPRACLGKKMAELMVMYVMAVLFRDFEFKEVLDDPDKPTERVSQNSLTLPMAGGLPCKVRQRQSAISPATVKQNT